MYISSSPGWVDLPVITKNGPIMGRLNDFLIQGVGNFNNNFPKLQMPGGYQARGCFSFDLIDT